MNKKVERMLRAMAIVLKDQKPELINAIHKVVNDKGDGYKFNMNETCESMRVSIKGK